MRSIILSTLPDATTLADITGVIRGGQLLDVLLRGYNRSAQVSFLNPTDAKGFFDHVCRHDLYIRHWRVEIRWAHRHFILPGHIANKITQGASRNLIIRRCDSSHTEKSIRDDLEHIHNLGVVHVRFVGGSCFISTNSLNNVMFARTCMMSRHKYRGSKIEWDVDECAEPLVQPLKLWQLSQPTVKIRHLNPMANRFQLLADTNDQAENGLLVSRDDVNVASEGDN